jgi:hypothetical protein
MVPFFIAAHLATGIITEIRQMLPLGFIIIPMALFSIYPQLAQNFQAATRQKS